MMMMIAEPPVRWRGPLSPLVHLANNWISLLGVVLVTSSTIFWLFLLPTTLRGETQNPYLGILAFLTLPDTFGLLHSDHRRKELADLIGQLGVPVGVFLERWAFTAPEALREFLGQSIEQLVLFRIRDRHR